MRSIHTSSSQRAQENPKEKSASWTLEEATEKFERWYKSEGHWVYPTKEKALDTWRTRGVEGLPDYRRLKKTAMRDIYIQTSALPLSVKTLLAEVRFTRRKINLLVRNKYSDYSVGDDGYRGFTASYNMNTNQRTLIKGAFGGGGLGARLSPVDNTSSPDKPLSDGLVIIQGQEGGLGTLAFLIVNDHTLEMLSESATQKGRRSALESAQSRRVAQVHLQRMGFNKFNAPELVGQLLGVLKGEGLEETVNEIQSKKIPQLVDTAWRNRAKRSAATHKYAADLRQLVASVLGEVTPFVKNPSTFFRTVLTDFTDYDFDEILGLREKWGLENLSVNATESGIYDAGERASFDRYSPPDYVQIEYEYPSKISGEFDLTISLREWPRRFAKAYKVHLKDSKGFLETLENLIQDPGFAKRLGLLYSKSAELLFKKNPEDFVDEWKELLVDFGQGLSETLDGSRLSIGWEYTKGSARLLDSGYQMSGGGINLRLKFSVEGTVEVENYLPVDDSNLDRYAGSAPFRKENGLRDAVVERLKRKGYKPVLFASNAFFVDADKYSINPTGMSFGKTYALQGEGIGIGDGVTINEEDLDKWADKAAAMIQKARFKKSRVALNKSANNTEDEFEAKYGVRPGDRFEDEHGVWVVLPKDTKTNNMVNIRLLSRGSNHVIVTDTRTLKGHYKKLPRKSGSVSNNATLNRSANNIGYLFDSVFQASVQGKSFVEGQHFKNYRAFKASVLNDSENWLEEWAVSSRLNAAEVTSKETVTPPVSSKVDSYGNRDTPEREDLEVAASVFLGVSYKINVVALAKKFAKRYRNLLVDPQNFLDTFTDVVGSRQVMVDLGRMLRASAPAFVGVEPLYLAQKFEDDIRDVAQRASSPGVDYSLEGYRLSDTSQKMLGMDLEIILNGVVSLEVKSF